MKIFLDTADVTEIKEALRLGVIDGVTTNPSHVLRAGTRPAELYPEICKLVPGPVSLETVGLDADTIVGEARELAKIGDNVVIKVPLMKEGLIAVKRLSAEGIKTNVTTTFSPLQALLAAKCGATYISPFAGRLDMVGQDGMNLVSEIHTIYRNYGYTTEVLVAAVRHPMHVLEAALIGADVCTMRLEVLSMMFEHPLSDISIQKFLDDWKNVPQ